MAIQGLQDTTDFTVGGDRAQRPENWREGSLLLFPNGSAPLMALSSVMRQESTDDPKFHWFEKVMDDQRFSIVGNVAASGGTTPENIVLTAAIKDILRIGNILRFENTGELVRVTALTGTTPATDITVERSVGTVAALAITVATSGVNPKATIVGSAYEEGSSAPAGIAYEPTEHHNLTQIFRNSLEMTETARRTRLRTGDQVREAKREALQYHNIEMERAAWFGNRNTLTVNSKPARLTEGFQGFMDRRGTAVTSADLATGESGNVITQTASTINFSDVENVMKEVFNYGSTEKVAFMGNTAALVIQRAIRAETGIAWNLNQGQKEFGMNVTRLVTPFGELVIKTHPLFNRMPGGLNTSAYLGQDSTVCILDMEYLRYRYLTGRDTNFDGQEQAPGDDQMKGGYLTEMGFEWRFPRAHALWTGVAGNT